MTSIPRFTSALFVGRERELAVLQTAWQAGQGRVVLFVGEPGIGKTRTAEELATYAQSRGAQVLWGRCYEGDAAPAFWPWVQILRAAIRDLDHEALSTTLASGAADIAQLLLPELRERLPQIPSAAVVDSPQARFRMFDSIARFVEHLTRRASRHTEQTCETTRSR
jgi:predicted ATPase